MTTIALLIPDGVGARNFLIGGFLPEAASVCDLACFHVVPDDLLCRYTNGLHDRVRWHPIVEFRQSLLSMTLQHTLGYAQMYWARTPAMQRALSRPIRGSARMRTFTRATRVLGRLIAGPRRMRVVARLHVRTAGASREAVHYEQLLRQLRPGVVFCSHQRPSIVVPAVIAANRLGIPTATFIFSWDNLTSKGRISAPFTHYLVWGDQMRMELLHYYPDIDPARVHVVGTPQFEPYADETILLPRAEFFRRIGADPSRPLICYSGGDAGTCPEDPDHLRVLMEHIRSGRIRHRPQVFVRPSPVDDGTRYQRVIRQFPELIFRLPQWIHATPGDWSRVVPLPEDVTFLANLVRHSDLNVNLGSTMTIDFALNDKPVVNLAFDCAERPIFGMPVWEFYYGYDHFQPVIRFGASRFARSREQLAEHVNAYLDDPSLDREGRRRLVELEIGVPIGRSCRRIVEVLQKIAIVGDSRCAST
ncbi:MAG: hypothetical protein ACK5AZ_11510 [Bryobacteraceae bacterium]